MSTEPWTTSTSAHATRPVGARQIAVGTQISAAPNGVSIDSTAGLGAPMSARPHG